MAVLNFAPVDFDDRSLYRNVQLHGNSEQIEEIIELSKANIRKNIDLYTAMRDIKGHLLEKYGVEQLHKSEEAIEFIIENAYCDDERRKHPLVSKEEFYAEIRKSCW